MDLERKREVLKDDVECIRYEETLTEREEKMGTRG
jgi:hypothetical protein